MKKIFLWIAGALLVCSTSCAQQSGGKAPAQAIEDKGNYTVKQLPLAQTEGIFESIAANCKGKVALVDFWATWCGPCRAAMKQVDSIKADYMARGVEFIYVTGASSPEDTWKNMLPGIDGIHYRLTDEQWRKVCSELKIQYIPCYFLLNRNGHVVYNNTAQGGYPGNDFVKAALDKELGNTASGK